MTTNCIVDRDLLFSLREVQAPGEPDVVAQVIQMFQDDAAARLGRARAALAGRDADALRLEAHSLRGTAGIIGAETLRAAAEALERRVPVDDWKDAELALQAVIAAVADVRAELATIDISADA